MSIQAQFNKAAQASLDKSLAKRSGMAMTTTASTAMSAGDPSVYGSAVGINNASTVYGPGSYITTTPSSTSQYTWIPPNPTTIGSTYGQRLNSLTEVSSAIKGSLLEEIIRCKSREECLEEYGKSGLKLYDSLVADILRDATQSEENFTTRMAAEVKKFEKLQQFILERETDPVLRTELARDMWKAVL
jgi:hypothetical protein